MTENIFVRLFVSDLIIIDLFIRIFLVRFELRVVSTPGYDSASCYNIKSFSSNLRLPEV